jgi:hypothetical protein
MVDIFMNLCKNGFAVETWPMKVGGKDYIQLHVSKFACPGHRVDKYNVVMMADFTKEETESLIFSFLEMLAIEVDMECEDEKNRTEATIDRINRYLNNE